MRRELKLPFLICCNNNSSNNTSLGLHVDINTSAQKEEDDGTKHEQCGNGIAQHPADRVLDVHNHSCSEDENDGKGGVVPIVEAAQPFSSFLRYRIKLVHAKRNTTWSNPA